MKRLIRGRSQRSNNSREDSDNDEEYLNSNDRYHQRHDENETSNHNCNDKIKCGKDTTGSRFHSQRQDHQRTMNSDTNNERDKSKSPSSLIQSSIKSKKSYYDHEEVYADALRSSQHQQRRRQKDTMKKFDNTKSTNITTDDNNDDDDDDADDDDVASTTTFSSAKRTDRNDNEEETVVVDVETLKIVKGLETDICSGDYIKFLNELDRRGTGRTTSTWKIEKTIILEGFRLFRFYVIKDQLSNPNAVVLSGDGWVKTIKNKFSAFNQNNANNNSKNKAIVVSGLLTFLTLSSLPGNYICLLVRRGGIECAMSMLDDHRLDEEISNLACALLISLTLNEKEGLNAKYKKIATVVKRLISIVSNYDDEYGRDFALRVIYHLTFHRKKIPDTNGKSLSNLVKNNFRESENNILALIHVLKDDNVRESTVEAVVSLLWRLSVPKDDTDDDNFLFLTSSDTIETIISTMDSFESIPIREAVCGILANMSMRKDFPTELSQRVFSSMHRFLLKIENIDEGLATCALHAICNMLEKPTVRTFLLSDQRVAETVLFLMKQFSKSEELVEFGCLAIGHASRHAQGIKESFTSLGGFDLVRDAFEEFVTTRGDNPSLDVKDASLCAFATLTGCRSGAFAAVSTGLIDIFETLLAVETDRDFAVVMDVIITNSRSCNTNELTIGGPEDTLRHQPHLFSELIENSTEKSDVSSLLQIMLGTGQSSMEIAFGSNEGYASLLSAMTRCANAVNVQEIGCGLLAEIYFHFPYPRDTSAVNTEQGPWTIHHQREALNIIQRAMDSHRDHVNIQYNGCLAVLNLVHPISELDGVSLNRQEMSSVIELSFSIILDCLRTYRTSDDNELQNSGISPGNYQLQVSALDALIIIQGAYPTKESIWSSVDIDVVLVLVGSGSNGVSCRSSAVLVSVLYNYPASSSYIMKCHGAIEKLISSLGSTQDDIEIQVNIYSILYALVTSADFNSAIATLIGQKNNGIHSLCMGLSSHPKNRMIPMTVCKILASIVPYLDTDAFSRSWDLMNPPIIEALKTHMEDPEVEAAVLDVLFLFCERDDDIKQILLEEYHIRMIISAMQFSLGSHELQKSGCNLLSLLTDFGSGKEIIGRFEGISTVINALLAHNDSIEVQKRGLVALKNLATASVNKPMLTEMGGVSIVIYSMYIHYRDPQVISTGLSALNNIAVDSVSRSVAQMNDQVLMIAVAAMRRFPMGDLVQKNACFYLKTCSYLPSNVRMMCEKSDELFPLLLQAADNFPELCAERANALVTKIASY